MNRFRDVADRAEDLVPPALDVDLLVSQGEQRLRRRRVAAAGAVALVAAMIVAGIAAFDAPQQSTSPAEQPTQTPGSPALPATSYFLDLRTGEQTPLAGDLIARDLVNPWYVFSPDGTRVAYNVCSEGPCADRNEIRVGDAEGNHTETTFDGEHALAWSPDGTRLVYSAPASIWTAEDPSLYVRDLATGQSTRLLDPGSARWLRHVDFGPNDVDISPDGSTVIFARPRSRVDSAPTWDVWAVPMTGGEPTLMLQDAPARNAGRVYTFGLQYLADGERIAFTRSHYEIAAARPGEPPQTLVTTGVPIWSMAMSPDRTRLAYDSGDGTHVVDLATGEQNLVNAGQSTRWVGNDSLLENAPSP